MRGGDPRPAGVVVCQPLTPLHPLSLSQVDYLRNHEYLQGRTYDRVHPVVYEKGSAPVDKTRELPRHAPARVLEGEPVEAMEVA